MARLVLDASALLPLFVPEEGSGAIAYLFEALEESPKIEIHAPRLLQVECAHALLKYVCRGVISAEAAREAYRDLLDLPLVLHGLRPLSIDDFEEASTRVVGAYDAVYLALARRLHGPLITSDLRFADKIKDLVQVVPLDMLPLTLRTDRFRKPKT